MRKDESGVLGMPFRIMVSLTVIGLMLPAVLVATQGLEDAAEETEMDAFAEAVADKATRAYLAGKGSTVSMTTDIPFGKAIGIGGSGADAYSVRMYSEGELIGRHYLDNPVFRIVCDDTLITGESDIVFRTSVVDGRCCVEASVQ